MAFLLNSYILSPGGRAVGIAAGSGAAAAVSIRILAAIGTAAGTGGLSAVSGEFGYESVAGYAAGTGGAVAAGASTADTAGSANGTGAATAVSLEPVGTAVGTGGASAVGTGLTVSVGTAAGNSIGTVAVPDLNEYIQFDADSNGGAAATAGVETWTHTPNGNPKGILIFTESNYNSSGSSASPYLAMYGDKVLRPIASSRKSSGEFSVLDAFYLGKDIPAGPQQVTLYSRGTHMIGQAFSLVSDVDTEVVNTVSLESSAIVDPSTTLELFGRESAVARVGMSGVTSAGQMTELPNWTRTDSETATSIAFIASRYDLYDSVDVTVGWEQLEDDANLIGVAISRAAAEAQDSPVAWVSGFSRSSGTTANLSWTHTPNADARGVLIFVVLATTGTDATGLVTYGGIDVPEIYGLPVLKAAAEAMGVSAFFLNRNLPAGPQTVVVNGSGSGIKVAYCYTLGSDDEIGIGSIATISSNSVADPVTTLPIERESLVLSAYATGATSGVSVLDEAINMELSIHTTASSGTSLYRYTSNTDITVGLRQATDDIVLVAVAVQRASVAHGTGSAIAYSEITYAGAGTATGSGSGLASSEVLGLGITAGSASGTGVTTAAGTRVVNSIGAATGSGGAPLALGTTNTEFNYIENHTDTANLTTYEFEAVDIGAEDPDRVIILSLIGGYPTALTINSILINGVSAGVRAFANSGTGVSFAAIASAKVPTGTSVTVTVTLSAVSTRLEMAVYRALNVPVLPLDTATASISFNQASATLTDLKVVPNGVFVGVCYGNNAVDLVPTYNGVDDLATDFISDPEGISHRATYVSAIATEDNATRDITFSWIDSSTSRLAAAGASWGRIVSGVGTASGAGATAGEGWYLQTGRKRVLEDGTSARLLEDGTSNRLME